MFGARKPAPQGAGWQDELAFQPRSHTDKWTNNSLLLGKFMI